MTVPVVDIDRVVDGQHCAVRYNFLIGSVQSIHMQCPPGSHLAGYLGKVILGHRENHSDRLKLRDRRQARSSVRLDDIAGIDQSQTNASIDGRGDAACSQRSPAQLPGCPGPL